MLKDGAEILAELISQFVIMSLGSKFLECFKTAKLRPVFENGKNYRPVSLLLLISKIIERAVHNQLIEHLEKYEIIIDYQFGFRSKHSVNNCLAHLYNQI